MNEVAAAKALKALIKANNENIVDGLVYQGQQVTLDQVTISGSTPPRSWPFIAIIIEESRQVDIGGNAAMVQFGVEYDAVIVIMNQVDGTFADDEAYEAAAIIHTLIGDRIISILKDETIRWIIDDETGLKFELDRGTDFRKSNSGDNWDDPQTGYHSRIASDIRILLKQGCIDDEKLWS